jgi:secondary thiamine-phosphate synthase enzyme
MEIIQKEIVLSPKPRGFHLITWEILEALPELKRISAGSANIFIKHTSASLTINENVSPEVKTDLGNYFNRLVPDSLPYFEHTLEGPDDMSAHVKSSILGYSLTVPVTDGSFNLGTWQGIYLCEHRNNGGRRKLVITVIGETNK